jgi:hypothetical protein
MSARRRENFRGRQRNFIARSIFVTPIDETAGRKRTRRQKTD